MRRIKHFLPYIVMYGMAFLWVIPILWMADTAFKPDDEIFSSPPRWIPSPFTLDHVKVVSHGLALSKMAASKFACGHHGDIRIFDRFHSGSLFICQTSVAGAGFSLYLLSDLYVASL